MICSALAPLPSMGESFAVDTPKLAAHVVTDGFRVTIPALAAHVATDGFRVTTPRLQARTATDGFRVSVPMLSARTSTHGYRVSIPTLVARTATEGFRVTIPPLRAYVGTDRFRVTLPVLRASLAQGKAEKQPDTAATSDQACEALKQCHSADEIARARDTLARLGLSPENTPDYCATLTAQLGACEDDPPISGEAPMTPSPSTPSAMPPVEPNDGPDLWNMNRCPPFERYMIELENRKTAGEDTTADGERVMILMMSLQHHLLNGRSDIWCRELTAGLPN